MLGWAAAAARVPALDPPRPRLLPPAQSGQQALPHAARGLHVLSCGSAQVPCLTRGQAGFLLRLWRTGRSVSSYGAPLFAHRPLASHRRRTAQERTRAPGPWVCVRARMCVLCVCVRKPPALGAGNGICLHVCFRGTVLHTALGLQPLAPIPSSPPPHALLRPRALSCVHAHVRQQRLHVCQQHPQVCQQHALPGPPHTCLPPAPVGHSRWSKCTGQTWRRWWARKPWPGV